MLYTCAQAVPMPTSLPPSAHTRGRIVLRPRGLSFAFGSRRLPFPKQRSSMVVSLTGVGGRMEMGATSTRTVRRLLCTVAL